METELLPVSSLPHGQVFSGLVLHESSSTHTKSHEVVGDGDILVGVCPTGGLVAFVSPSYQAQFVVGQPGRDGEALLYINAFQGILDIDREPMSNKPRPQATSVLVVPIAFRSRQGSVQRSSIVLVGFTDGYVRGYSKSGQRVLAQSMHTDAVRKLTCMVSAGAPQTKSSSQSNVVVLYLGVVCVIDGRSLVNTIRSYVQGRMSEDDTEPVFLSYKKWKLMDQTTSMDVALLSPSTPTVFDHLCEASCVAGFNTTVRSGPTPGAQLIAVGENPMVALYKITKDAGQLNMSEVMHAAAYKMTSAVLGKISQASGWLRWGKSETSTKPVASKEKVQLSSHLPMTANIPDGRRTMLNITVSPQGNLAAIVDCFGRVLLLECDSLVIRRMWKGYRDAQCGWILIHDSPSAEKPTRGKRRNPKHVPHPHSHEQGKAAQCLCIYAPRRGIVELWPVQTGRRLAVFNIGRGCRLLYAPHDLFTFDLSDDETRTYQDGGVFNGQGIRKSVLLLHPDGQLLAFSVPFPLLTRHGDPTSFDTHLMKKLPQALQSGDVDLLVLIFSGIKSSQSMKQAVDILIGAHSSQSTISYDVIVKLLTVAMEKIDRMDPATYPLYHYVGGVKQGVELLQGIEELIPYEATPTIHSVKLNQDLQDMCGLPSERATTISECLTNYFSLGSQRKKVVKRIDLRAFTRCFDLPSKVGNVLLSTSKLISSGVSSEISDSVNVRRTFSRSYSSLPARLALKETLSSSTLLDVGSTLFQRLLTEDVIDDPLSRLYLSCGIPAASLLSLLCRVFLCALSAIKTPSLSLVRLNKLLTMITASQGAHVGVTPSSSLTIYAPSAFQSDDTSQSDLWTDVCLQCSQSYNVGHALLLILVCQKFASTAHSDESVEKMATQEQDWESWESVTSDRELWISLMHRLEVLTLVSNVIGRDSLVCVCPAPYAVCEEEAEELGERNIDISSVLSLDESIIEGLCAATLEKYGTGLIAHYLSKWLIQSNISPEFVARTPSDPHDNIEPNRSHLVFQLSPLLKLLPDTLSHEALLSHCAWQVACDKTLDPQLALDFMSHIHNIQLIPGIISVMWHCLCENTVVKVIEALKRRSASSPRSYSILAVSRNMFSWLYRLSLQTDEPNQITAVNSERDLLSLSDPPQLISLMALIKRFPRLNPTVIKTYLELLLVTEVSLIHGKTTAVNIASFFPTWLRGALKKGAFKTAWQEQVPVQLQQKRTKYLSEMVRVYFASENLPELTPTVTCAAIRQLPHTPISTESQSVNLEVAKFKDLVFLLVDLWGLDGDTVRKQWTCAFFAVGLPDQGKEVFLSIKDKSHVSQDLVSFCGALSNHLLLRMDNKARRLAVMAQASPSLIEWLRNQSKNQLLQGCPKLEPDWMSVSQLLTLTQPYVTGKTSLTSILTALAQLVQTSISS